MNKGLLVDTMLFQYDKNLLTESSHEGKLIVSGILQRAEAKNQNGRVYPAEILMREVKKYQEGPIREKRALGELDHPESTVVNLKNVSHNILDTWWKGNDLYGKIEVLSTPSGNILKELLRAGIKLGISSRGMGSVREIYENDSVEVQDDFNLICWDFVSEPSTHGAWMNPVKESLIAEGVQNQADHKFDKINEIISDIMCDGFGFCPCSLPEKE